MMISKRYIALGAAALVGVGIIWYVRRNRNVSVTTATVAVVEAPQPSALTRNTSSLLGKFRTLALNNELAVNPNTNEWVKKTW
jgi:hypothetical protein